MFQQDHPIHIKTWFELDETGKHEASGVVSTLETNDEAIHILEDVVRRKISYLS